MSTDCPTSITGQLMSGKSEQLWPRRANFADMIPWRQIKMSLVDRRRAVQYILEKLKRSSPGLIDSQDFSALMNFTRRIDAVKSRYREDGICVVLNNIGVFLYENLILKATLSSVSSDRSKIVIDSSELKARCSNNQIWELDDDLHGLFPDYSSKITPMSDNDTLELQNEPLFLFRSPFVAEVEDITVVGQQRPLAMSNDGKFIVDTFHFDPHSQAFSNSKIEYIDEGITSSLYCAASVVFERTIIPTENTQSVASILYWSSNNYYHWILEEGLKLRGISQYQEETGNKVTLILPPNAPDFIQELLDILGFKTFSRWDSEPIQVDRLVVPSFPEPTPGALEWLRETVFNAVEIDDNGPEWIYISRQNSGGRMIENFGEIKPILNNHGVEIVCCENLSLREQVNLFSTAKGVIGPHGAGLTNIIWGDNLTIIEIFNNVVSAPFYILADLLDHNYHALSGKEVGQANRINRNIRVDVDEFKQLLRESISE